ncbi:SAV_915 family protein [Streptomyces sp. NPDC002574]|uniref:SAV_915 family protein n=1 Tax=Streptomyces sp. NPDC002574 TaxID=3364652 RepID=UPI0036CB44AD
MTESASEDDPEPCEPVPAGAGGTLCVPVRPGPAGPVTRMFRTPLGDRTAVAFTTPERLTATLGAEQEWVDLSESALRSLARPLGVTALTVDPQFAAPAVKDDPDASPDRFGSQIMGVLRVTGAFALVDALCLWIR